MKIQRTKGWWLAKARKEDGCTTISAGMCSADSALAKLVMANTRVKLAIPATCVVENSKVDLSVILMYFNCN
jgi:hypothetical protein